MQGLPNTPYCGVVVLFLKAIIQGYGGIIPNGRRGPKLASPSLADYLIQLDCGSIPPPCSHLLSLHYHADIFLSEYQHYLTIATFFKRI